MKCVSTAIYEITHVYKFVSDGHMGQCISRSHPGPTFSRHYDAESVASSAGGISRRVSRF